LFEGQINEDTPPPPPSEISSVNPPQPPPPSPKNDVDEKLKEFNKSEFVIPTKQKDGTVKQLEYPITEILDKLNKKDKKLIIMIM
jgi:hypothetical protein